MDDRIFARIRSLFDVPVMQNSLRGLWAEAMVGELLGDEWTFTGQDWAAWDFERRDGKRLEVKQSATRQSWGTFTKVPRFGIAAPAGHYPDGKTWKANPENARMADIYVFAWHDGPDQRLVAQWRFYVVIADRLPGGQRTIGLSAIRRLAEPVEAAALAETVGLVAAE